MTRKTYEIARSSRRRRMMCSAISIAALMFFGFVAGCSTDLSIQDVAEMEKGLDVPGVVSALDSRDQKVQGRAAEALEHISGEVREGKKLPEPEQAVEPLIKLFRDKKRKYGDHDGSWTRSNAANILGILRDERAVGPLIAALDGKDGIYSEVSEALGRIGDPRANTPLARGLSSSDQFTRWASSNALSMIGAPSVDTLAGVLKSGKSDARFSAALALEVIGNPKTVKLVDDFLAGQGIELREVRAKYKRAYWRDDVLLIALEHYDSQKMALDIMNGRVYGPSDTGVDILGNGAKAWAERNDLKFR